MAHYWPKWNKFYLFYFIVYFLCLFWYTAEVLVVADIPMSVHFYLQPPLAKSCWICCSNKPCTLFIHASSDLQLWAHIFTGYCMCVCLWEFCYNPWWVAMLGLTPRTFPGIDDATLSTDETQKVETVVNSLMDSTATSLGQSTVLSQGIIH